MKTYMRKNYLTDQELFEIFPEAKEVVLEKLKEWEVKRYDIADIIKRKLRIIKSKSNPQNQWFWREWIKINEVEALNLIDKHIARLKRQLAVIGGQKIPSNLITKDEIERALCFPINDLFAGKFRRSGRNFIGICPFHPEKSPSFYIYSNNNTCWCFGCHQGGDTINVVRLLYGCSFREAVSHLTGK